MIRNELNRWFGMHRILLTNTSSLIGTTIITSSLGFLYWWVAARQFPPESVGLASAAISAMMLLGTIGILGVGTLLIGELQRQPENRASLIVTALIIVGAAGGILGFFFEILSPRICPNLSLVSGSFKSVGLFSLGVSLTSIAIVVDQSLIGLLRGGLQLQRNIIFSVVKLVTLYMVGIGFLGRSGIAIYATWIIGNLASLAYLALVFLFNGLQLSALKPDWGQLRKLGQPAISHHLLNLTLQAPGLLLPVIVTVLLSTRMNAYFYTAWMIANFAFAAPVALTTVLYAVGAGNPSVLAQKIKFTLKLSILLGLLGNIVLFFGADFVLGLFDANYAKQAGWSLRILGLGFFPLMIKCHYIAAYRIHNLINKAIYFTALGALVELTAAVLGADIGGLTGLSLGWLIGVCLEAALMAPAIYRIASRTERQESIWINMKIA